MHRYRRAFNLYMIFFHLNHLLVCRTKIKLIKHLYSSLYRSFVPFAKVWWKFQLDKKLTIVYRFLQLLSVIACHLAYKWYRYSLKPSSDITFFLLASFQLHPHVNKIKFQFKNIALLRQLGKNIAFICTCRNTIIILTSNYLFELR